MGFILRGIAIALTIALIWVWGESMFIHSSYGVAEALGAQFAVAAMGSLALGAVVIRKGKKHQAQRAVIRKRMQRR